VQVLDVKRGQAAGQALKGGLPAPQGMEYLVVKLRVKSTHTDGAEHLVNGCSFHVTGDRRIRHGCGEASVAVADPHLEAKLHAGDQVEGWAAYVVAQGEGNLILVIDEPDNMDETAIRYVALDDGATVGVPPELAEIEPNDLGTQQDSPARRSEKVITEDWELTVLEIVRGDAAWTMVRNANDYNKPPAEGMEYIAAKVHVRYISTIDQVSWVINSHCLRAMGSTGILNDPPMVFGLGPDLSAWLYPAGESEGWVVAQAAQGESGLVLVFQPLLDFNGVNKRFLSLEP